VVSGAAGGAARTCVHLSRGHVDLVPDPSQRA